MLSREVSRDAHYPISDYDRGIMPSENQTGLNGAEYRFFIRPCYETLRMELDGLGGRIRTWKLADPYNLKTKGLGLGT
jgi:hypothetical protein